METTLVYWGHIGMMEKKMDTTLVHWGHIGMMEKKMDTAIAYWGNIGMMANKMETTLAYWGENGRENGNYYTTILHVQFEFMCVGIREYPHAVLWVLLAQMIAHGRLHSVLQDF